MSLNSTVSLQYYNSNSRHIAALQNSTDVLLLQVPKTTIILPFLLKLWKILHILDISARGQLDVNGHKRNNWKLLFPKTILPKFCSLFCLYLLMEYSYERETRASGGKFSC